MGKGFCDFSKDCPNVKHPGSIKKPAATFAAAGKQAHENLNIKFF